MIPSAALWRDRMWHAALLVLVAGAIVMPLALRPMPLNDSHWINLVWSDQFSAGMRGGNPWPRWLPASHGGLGAPVFFFYGPVLFWVAGLFACAGVGTWGSLLLAAWASLASGGLGMAMLLRDRGRLGLVVAALFMAAPYRLLDLARRGALAEFAAAGLLPWVALGMRRAASGRVGGLASAYAALVMTHLPTALLASLFLLPMLAWQEAGRRFRAWAGIAGGVALGLGLAAAYLLPALMLQGATAMTRLSGLSYLHPSAWSIWSLGAQPPTGVVLVDAIAGLTALLGVILFALRPCRWAAFATVTALLGLGVAPWLWSLPLIDRVQFPWRILALSEFGLALALARVPLDGPRLLLIAAPSIVLSILILDRPDQGGNADRLEIARLLRHHPDVTEYLPAGTGEPIGIESDWALRLAKRMPAEATAGDIATIRRFAFPSWGVRCGSARVPTWAAPGTGLISYHGSGCVVERIVTGPESAGLTLSAAALAILAALTFPAALWRRMRLRAGAADAREGQINHVIARRDE